MKATREPLARRNLSETILERLQGAIKSGAYEPDERLPSEHDLAAEFEVSRPVIREALRRLRDQGLIYSRQGAGSFVRSAGLRQPLGFAELENVSDLLNCYDFRLALEPEAAASAARRGEPRALAEMKAALEMMRDATNRLIHREDADFLFHLAIARAAKNSYFSTTMEALKDHIAAGMRFHGISVRREARGLAGVFVEHKAIYEAICNSQPESARDLMRAHLIHSRDRLFEPRPLDGVPVAD